MFRIVGSEDQAPPPPESKGIISMIYYDPFNWSLCKGAVGFILGVIAARVVSEEWASMS